ncbi:retropepsin-like aspartic protease [Polaribacter sp. Hel_I_88]|uniref:retropepsin-like aspartic protease n=1 Tax=Polaribacter sp. Hel_I_88 TaxID=1250006 RepID=UPI001E41B013|nr:retropepsin-like aspartic protease [Polaribacter sp. Hel_I_88]
MKKTVLFIILLMCIFSLDVNCQEGFEFLDKTKTKQRVSFKFINNLIIIPLEINGRTLSFILDSGVNKTILFNITKNDSIGLNNVEKVSLQGLGNGNPVEALLSKKNTVNLKGLTSSNETLFVIVEDYLDLSAKMGITIHGIVGYNLLKNFVVKINYKAKKIVFYKPENYKAKKCRKCEVFPLTFYRRKPYIDAQVQLDTVGNSLTDVKLLIDTGGSDALWLFEDTKDVIQTPNRFFTDILGEGLSGLVYGNRSRIPKIKLKSFELEKPTVSFLDSLSTNNAISFKERNGSIGAAVLKRFVVWFDYPNRKITLKKNSSLKKGFNYNMSGLEVIYSGAKLVKEKDINTFSDSYQQKANPNNSISFITSFSYKFKPTYKINSVVKESPGGKAGILKDDIILKINGKSSYDYTLGQIINLFKQKKGRKIKMLIERKGVAMKFQFRLEAKI